MKILGIDPGKSGGLALLDTDDHAIPAQVWKMPETEMDVWDALHHGGLRWQAHNLQYASENWRPVMPSSRRFMQCQARV